MLFLPQPVQLQLYLVLVLVSHKSSTNRWEHAHSVFTNSIFVLSSLLVSVSVFVHMCACVIDVLQANISCLFASPTAAKFVSQHSPTHTATDATAATATGVGATATTTTSHLSKLKGHGKRHRDSDTSAKTAGTESASTTKKSKRRKIQVDNEQVLLRQLHSFCIVLFPRICLYLYP